ncbi:MAG: cytochrome C [Candidatus Binataceae bacterium]
MKAQSKLLNTVILSSLAGGAMIGSAMILGWTILPNLHAGATPAFAQTAPIHAVPLAKHGGVVIELCDGVTHTEVTGLKPGQAMSHAQALAVTGKLMAEWQRKHPGEKWEMAQAGDQSAPSPEHPASSATQPAAAAGRDATANIGGPGSAAQAAKLKSQQGDTYASFHDREFKIWKAETDAFVAQGSEIFHSNKLLGSTIGVSCDMCHPNAANTHPETYPKYQEQLQKVALLRDMINWCIENPVKGKTLDPNDPKMRALEAYILASRKGTPLDYGKH